MNILREKFKKNHIFYIVITLVLILLISLKILVFGSKIFTYHYISDFSIKPIIVFLLIMPVILFALNISYKHYKNHEKKIIALWILIGFISQIVIFSVYPYNLGNIVQSDSCTSFYSVAQDYGVKGLLANFNTISWRLPLHARTNMPGKILFFYFLNIFTKSPEVMGYLIAFFSCLGGILVYLISKKFFNDKLVALYSLILYLFIPARIFFTSGPNIITPIFALVPLLLLLKYLESKKLFYMALFGFSLYVLLIFEPGPLALGIIFMGIIIRSYVRKEISMLDTGKIVFITLITFLITHLTMILVFNYNIIDSAIIIFNRQFDYNAANKVYMFLTPNMKNFFINTGIVQSTILLIFTVTIIYTAVMLITKRKMEKFYKFILNPGIALTILFIITLLTVDFMRLLTSEIIRTWIFFMVFVQIIVAYVIVKKLDKLSFKIVLASTILQTLVTISMIGFLMC
jgi:hypothetical protein